ncbi:competence protein ComK [Peribacillus butanolivorans]|uniref:competence protein ComK n=1 Tax=Peribacillus butanolivorans TaxID=421767 RepID=UPI0035DF94E3
MMIRNSYLMNRETIGMLVEYDSKGVEMTRVIEGKNTFFVIKTPLEILNDTLNYFGSDLNGALVGAKSVLVGKYKLPICINAQLGMAWFSCSSFRKGGGIWLSYIHINHFEKISDKETMVHTNFGHSLPVSMSTNQLEFKRDQAAYLHTTFYERSTLKKTFYYEPGSGITFCKEPGDINYKVKENEKEE